MGWSGSRSEIRDPEAEGGQTPWYVTGVTLIVLPLAAHVCPVVWLTSTYHEPGTSGATTITRCAVLTARTGMITSGLRAGITVAEPSS